MTLDPSLSGGISASAGGGANGSYDPTNPLPGQFIEANGGRFYLLGTNPSTGAPLWSSFVASKAGTVTVGGRLVDAGTGQVIYEPPQNAGGDGVGASTVYSQTQQNARDQAQIAEQARQFNETLWMDKARGDQQTQIAQGNLGVNQGNLAVSQGRLGLDTQQQLIDYYNNQANRYSNPRNFMESLFNQRRQPAPQGAADFAIGRPLGQFYGNGAQTQTQSAGPSYMAPQRALPAPAQQQAATSAYNPASDPNRGTRFEGLSGFNTDGTLRLAPNDPDAEKLMAAHPGQYRVGYAQGGVVPEPVMGVGLRSGKTYTFGENGPEGVVPASYLPRFLQQRHGQMGGYANGGLIGFDAGDYGTGDPYNPDPVAPPPPTPNDPSNPYSGAYNPYDPQTTQSYGPQVPTGYGPVQTPGVDYGAIGAALAASANAANPNLNPLGAALGGLGTTMNSNIQPTPKFDTTGAGLYGTTTTPAVTPTTQTVDPNNPYGIDWSKVIWDPGAPPKVEGVPYDPTLNPNIRQPTQLPQGGSTPTTDSALTSATLTPRDVASAGTFGNISGNRPTFLPGEDQGSPLAALLSANALPPFLSRLFAQGQGIQSQGTNQPQPFALPNDVPLPSKLAYLQMNPSEQQALLSYASSYGVTPEDFLAAIEAASPTGGPSQSPLFGNHFAYARQ